MVLCRRIDGRYRFCGEAREFVAPTSATPLLCCRDRVLAPPGRQYYIPGYLLPLRRNDMLITPACTTAFYWAEAGSLIEYVYQQFIQYYSTPLVLHYSAHHPRAVAVPLIPYWA